MLLLWICLPWKAWWWIFHVAYHFFVCLVWKKIVHCLLVLLNILLVEDEFVLLDFSHLIFCYRRKNFIFANDELSDYVSQILRPQTINWVWALVILPICICHERGGWSCYNTWLLPQKILHKLHLSRDKAKPNYYKNLPFLREIDCSYLNLNLKLWLPCTLYLGSLI